MALSLGATTPTALYLGTTAISAAYLGATQVYSTGGGWSPVGKTGVVAAWDMETVYQDAALSTAASDTDPVGGVPDLTGNSRILFAVGAERPVKASGGGLHWLEFDGTDDQFELAFPIGDRTTNMTLILGLSMPVTDTDFILFSSSYGSNTPYVGLGIDGGGSATDYQSGAVSYHINNGSAVTKTRDALRDAVAIGSPLVVEMRAMDTVTSYFWVSFGSPPTLFNYRNAQRVSAHKFYRGVFIDAITASADDVNSAREWVAAGTGVTL